MKDILIIGESCRDIFVYCEANRLCPDVPVPALSIIDQMENPGMAKNVQRNVLSLIKSCDIVTNKDWYSITKSRYVHKSTNHMFFRVDTPHKIRRINLNFDYKLIIISDYNKGFLTEDDIEFICSNHPNVFIDTKKILGNWAKLAKFIKINNYEYTNSLSFIDGVLNKKIICTKGSDGAEFNGKIFPVEKVEVKDSSGAGDSFMASLAVKYLQTSNIETSINFANKKASEVVKHIGVTIIS
jgi:bifunctional ADP-heptose synthase (sugar kinase/adenylyltransferase)